MEENSAMIRSGLVSKGSSLVFRSFEMDQGRSRSSNNGFIVEF